MSDKRVQDHPQLRRRGAGVVDVDQQAFLAAQMRVRQAHRFNELEQTTQRLEQAVEATNQKLDMLLEILKGKPHNG